MLTELRRRRENERQRDMTDIEGFPAGGPVTYHLDKVLDAHTHLSGSQSGVAGQTVFHCHIHLIPCRRDDVEDPTGGVRNTIPGKGAYRH